MSYADALDDMNGVFLSLMQDNNWTMNDIDSMDIHRFLDIVGQTKNKKGMSEAEKAELLFSKI